MSRLWLLVLLFVWAACSHEARPAPAAPGKTPETAAAESLPPAQPMPRTVPPDPRYYAPAKAPDPLSCLADKDCIADIIVDTSAGCCVAQSDPMPQTWAWHAWVTEHRLSPDCEDAKCKPVAVPATLPRACLLEARCEDKRCTNTCAASDAGVR